MACTESEQFKVWLRKAATAESLQELFGGEPVARKARKPSRSTKAPKPRSKR